MCRKSCTFARRVEVVVLVAPSNRLPDLLPLMSEARGMLNSITPGEVVEIEGS